MKRLPVGIVDVPQGIDPRGICGTCRFFIDDEREVEQELRFISGATGVTLHTSERLKDTEGYEIGAEVARTVTHYPDMWSALLHRINADPQNFGMCEKGGPIGYPGAGPARLVHRLSGTTADETGARLDVCTNWQPRSKLWQLLGSRPSKNWREKREKALALRSGARPTFVQQECPWHKGKPFLLCCGREMKA